MLPTAYVKIMFGKQIQQDIKLTPAKNSESGLNIEENQ